MKLSYLILPVMLLTGYTSYAQNAFPATGKVGIGTTSPQYPLDVQHAGTGEAGAIVGLQGFVNAPGVGAYLRLIKSRGATTGTFSPTLAGDGLGAVDFMGVRTDNAIGYAARIVGYQDGTAGLSYIPGKLSFFTGSTANAMPERMTITSSGNVGIGTVVPSTKLDVNGAISINGVNVNDSQSISVLTDGTYIVASGNRVKGTYILNFESANRVQTVVLLANATQFDYNSSLSILSNTSYGGSVVMSNFRFVFSSDNATVYLIFDVANRNGGTSVSAHFNGTGYFNANWGGVLPASPVGSGIYPLVVNMGNVSIGTPDSKGYKFAVNGSAIATSMTVKLNSAWPDYVFKKDYQLPSLQEVKVYIDQNQHLPEIPSEGQIAKDGLNLGEMNRLLMKKVEELTLYLIEKDNKEKELENRIKTLEQQSKIK